MSAKHNLSILAGAACALAAATSCGSGTAAGDGSIFSCAEYTVWPDSVVQGPYTARAVSATELVTNYRSAETSAASPVATFRFSVNSRDNEMPRTMSHRALIGRDDNHVYTFGSTEGDPAVDEAAAGDTLAVNTPWRVRLDLRPMLRAFKAQGWWATPTGDTIQAADFKGVWVAGSVEPLSWDFENLYNADDRRLTLGKDSIYEAVIMTNPPVQRQPDPKGWRVEAPNPAYPQYSSEQTLIDCLYNMAVDELANVGVRPDGAFRAGKEWDGVWTRDVSYAIYLALAVADPARSINSLRAKVSNGRIVQDTGTGGAWPVSSDRVVWALAAWECYLSTGDRDWLTEAYNVIKATLEDDMHVVYDPAYRLMHGEQSYLDWREQTYPYWMQPADIYGSMCLGTNVVFRQAFYILGRMADELGEDATLGGVKPEQICSELTEAINAQLWAPDKGRYSGYLYGAPYTMQSPATDNLGQALAVLFGVATREMAQSVLSTTPIVAWGTPSVMPQMAEIRPYHNDAVWPFVQAYWNLAAAHARNDAALRAGLGAIYRAAAMFATNKELFVAHNGDYRGTAVNSDAQLWSVAGNMAMVYRIYAGIELTTEGMELHPVVPACLPGVKRLTGVKYRGATLDITVSGTGDKIARFAIDGRDTDRRLVPADIAAGSHTVEIVMANNALRDSRVNIGEQQWLPAIPVVTWDDARTALLAPAEDVSGHAVYLNGVENALVTGQKWVLSDPTADPTFTQINFAARGEGDKPLTGFACASHYFAPAGTETLLPVNLMTTPTDHTSITLEVEVAQPGRYFASVRYANGSGPINTENKCALRTLTVNGREAGPIVMPQRGTDEWLSTGYSNTLEIELTEGRNTLSIDYLLPYNRNMNGEVNNAIIHYLRLIRK